MRCHVPLLLSAVAAASGCTCGRSSSSSPAVDSLASDAGAVTALVTDGGTLAVFSAPIAAARSGNQDIVAGLVASEGVIRVASLSSGKVSWTADVLHDVAWSPDAELRLQPTPAGFAVMWRGPHSGKASRSLVLLGPKGEPLGGPTDVGAALCLTDTGIAWVETRAAGSAKVMGRAWASPIPRSLATVAPDRDPALVCGDHDVVVLADGDDDLTATTVSFGDAPAHAPVVLVRDADFGDDEEREHDAYTVGDDLGIVRVASAGALAMRDVPRGGTPSPWRKLTHSIPGDDDVVAVDGDAAATLIVYTEDAGPTCPGIGSAAASVHALRVVRATGEETVLELAPADCARSPGPFWIAPAPAGPAVAWIERKSGAPGSAPISGATFRVVTAGGVQPGHLEQAADALVDAGCDTRGCAVAALLRPPGADGMQPESIGIFSYP